MISRYEAILNGTALSAVDPDIRILDISHDPPTLQTEKYDVANRNGERTYSRYRGTASITISFELSKYSIAKRQTVCQQVCAWAKNGGILETNDRPGQRLRCICEKFPAVASAMRWKDTLQMTFTAYALPFWEEKFPQELTLSGTSGGGTLYVPGNYDGACAEVTVTAGATLTRLTLNAGDTSITLEGLSVPAGSTIVISYDENMIQQIKTGNISLLNKRKGNDDLLIKCGEINALSFTANGNATVKFSVRGLWL